MAYSHKCRWWPRLKTLLFGWKPSGLTCTRCGESPFNTHFRGSRITDDGTRMDSIFGLRRTSRNPAWDCDDCGRPMYGGPEGRALGPVHTFDGKHYHYPMCGQEQLKAWHDEIRKIDEARAKAADAVRNNG